MRILFLTHSFNSLTQRLFVALREQGHDVSVEFDINDSVSLEAVELHRPDLIVAPFLKRAIPSSIWRNHVCLIVHPGIVGDRGPSSLDWAILNDEPDWGVTVLQANAEMDAGDIWASAGFPMRAATKASLYRGEVADAAVAAVTLAVERFEAGGYEPTPLQAVQSTSRGCVRPLVKQADRRIDWANDSSETVLRKIRSADGFPGVADDSLGRRLFLYNAAAAPELEGEPGTLVATSGEAIGVATIDGGVWIGHLRDPDSAHPFKLPATRVLADQCDLLPKIGDGQAGAWRDLRYEERDGVGYLHFPFYNGAMATHQCEALLDAYERAARADTQVIVLCGGAEFWSNGMDLNQIEAADSAADESWRNINAIDDLAAAIIRTTSHLTVSALRGNAGAGGVFLARAADRVWAHDGVILNPHYKDMGNLYGSEYWTYLLPRACGEARAQAVTQARLPVGVSEARELGLIDQVLAGNRPEFDAALHDAASALATAADLPNLLASKAKQRAADERIRPLADYRQAELERMRLNFYGFDPSYHVARYNFVYKVAKSRTPLTLATHRRQGAANRMRDVS